MSTSLSLRTRIWALGLLVAVFAAGAWAGARFGGAAGSSPGLPPFLYRAVLDSLDLSPAQRSAADEVVTRHVRAVDSTMRTVGRALADGSDSAHVEIEGILGPVLGAEFREGLRAMEEGLGIGMRVRAPADSGGPPGAAPPRDEE